ncbi:MAG TPA: NAD(P)-dependent oxidoreductase [Casimicrobiaceae bacterium]|jgi:3-hydroxyisobutyrate dehydrogenase
MRIGFVGLGRMGLPMARNIVRAGHELTVHSRDAAAVAQLERDGASTATSPRELASIVDVLCSCRVSPEHSREVFLGADGAIAARGRDLLCIDFATVDPETSRSIAADLAEQGIGFLDAPVSGGPGGAAAASLSIMVGGSEADFARARPLLEVLGKSIFHLGSVGCGVSAKLCNNLITGTLHVLIAEAMVLGTKLGIEPGRLYEVLRASSARSNTLERVVPNHFLPGNYEPASALDMMIKDLECVTATAKAAGVRMLLPTVAQQCYIEASGLGHGAKDLAAVILPMEEIAQVRVGRSPAPS